MKKSVAIWLLIMLTTSLLVQVWAAFLYGDVLGEYSVLKNELVQAGKELCKYYDANGYFPVEYECILAKSKKVCEYEFLANNHVRLVVDRKAIGTFGTRYICLDLNNENK
jgi:hypothetical protein